MADNTPAARTGPPRSLSFLTASLSFPAQFSDNEDQEFRGALEYASHGRKSKSRRDKGKSLTEEWNPKIWFHESPRDEIQAMEPESSANETLQAQSSFRDSPATVRNSTASYRTAIRRAFSAPYDHTTQTPSDKGKQKEENKEKEKDTSHGSAKWAKLRTLLPRIAHHNQSIVPGPSVITSHAVNITDELITGGLSTLMLRLWLERDEKGRRRVPVLLHRLRIRVSDSIHPLQQRKSVFRIECEYANGAARWVIYRELRDFVSLHAHYTVSNVYNRIKEELPEFPMTSTRLIYLSIPIHLVTFLYRLTLFKVSQDRRGQGEQSRLCSYATRGTRELYHKSNPHRRKSCFFSQFCVHPTPLSTDVPPFFKSTRWIP
jgi:phospholipase D1/2